MSVMRSKFNIADYPVPKLRAGDRVAMCEYGMQCYSEHYRAKRRGVIEYFGLSGGSAMVKWDGIKRPQYVPVRELVPEAFK